MRGILNALIAFASVVLAEENTESNNIPPIGNAHDALDVLKKYSQIDHKYKYEIPKGTPIGNTFFHEYFDYANELNETRFNRNLTSGENGFQVEISDDTTYFFNSEDIESYGQTEFDTPLGPLRQIDEDVFDQVETNWTKQQWYAFSILEKLGSENDSDALRILADFYTFGFLNVHVDLARAKSYYEKILAVSDDIKTEAHAHFMLGVFYSTGLFGKTERDEAKGLIHYTFASDLGSIQAQMALAHKHMFGISVTQNYQLAIYYFSLVLQRTEEYVSSLKTPIVKSVSKTENITDSVLIFEPSVDKFSIRWSDTIGGLYGDKTSESSDSIRYFETFTDYEKIKKYSSGPFDDSDDYTVGNDDTLDAFSLFYFSAQRNYHGDYLHARDFDSAFKYAEICVANGFVEPEVKEAISTFEEIEKQLKQENLDSYQFKITIDEEPSPLLIFVGRCSQYLGHMYLRGQGTNVDYEKALYYLEIGKSLSSTNLFRNDIGLINYYGLGVPKNPVRATSIFEDGMKLSSARYYRASVLIDDFNVKLLPGQPTYVENNIYALLSTSATHNLMARRKLLELYEDGKLNMNYDTMIGYYNSYLKLYENLFFDFKIPFFAFINAKEDDITSNEMWTSLVGMAIESELGYETAQSSLGSILYPTVGKFSSKKFRNVYETFSKIFTPKRFQEAVSYFELSARHSNRDSVNFLGDMYYNGLYNVPNAEDPMWTKKWWMYVLPASETLENNFFVSLIDSISGLIMKVALPVKVKLYDALNWDNKIHMNQAISIIPRDLSKSISYYQDAASMWSQIGSYNVGWAYEYGIGVTQDLHLAKRYYDNVLTVSDVGYVSVKIAVLRVRLKAILWNFLGCDGHGVKELGMEHRTWKQRLTMITGWLLNRE